jgi:hypothetical protein
MCNVKTNRGGTQLRVVKLHHTIRLCAIHINFYLRSSWKNGFQNNNTDKNKLCKYYLNASPYSAILFQAHIKTFSNPHILLGYNVWCLS